MSSHPALVAAAEALRRYDILDTPPEGMTDDLVDLVAVTLGASCAALTFVADDRAWTKASTASCNQAEVDAAASLAPFALEHPDDIVRVRVDDAPPTRHRLADHPVFGTGADGPITRWYGRAVRGPDGLPVAVLEVGFHTEPAHPRFDDVLTGFAKQLSRWLEVRDDGRAFRRLVERSGDPVVLLDANRAVIEANPALARLVRADDVGTLVGQPFVDLVAADDRAEVAQALERFAATGPAAVPFEFRLVRSDRRTVPCEATVSRGGDAAGELQLVLHDLSSRLRAEEERARLSEQLARAQRLDAIGRLAGGLAHDLNNLLFVMTSNLALAQESLADLAAHVGPSLVEDVRADLLELELAIDRASVLTGKLRGFSERGRESTDDTELPEVLDAVRRLIAAGWPAEVELHMDVAEHLPAVAVDPLQLERSLVNLVLNARDAIVATPDRGTGGGQIRISAEVIDPFAGLPVDLGGVQLPVLDGRRLVRIDVSDDGSGMDAEVQARAFEPLFTTKGDRGSGLGLASVAAFVDEADGAIAVASEPGQGTRVTVLLPAAEPFVTSPVPDGDAPKVFPGAKLLLVDPGERTRLVVATMLGTAGYGVREVRSGEEALAVLDECGGHGIDAVLTELSLPGMSGPQLVTRIREDHPVVAVLAMSSIDVPGTVAGAPTVTKPFSHARLLRAVGEVLRDNPRADGPHCPQPEPRA